MDIEKKNIEKDMKTKSINFWKYIILVISLIAIQAVISTIFFNQTYFNTVTIIIIVTSIVLIPPLILFTLSPAKISKKGDYTFIISTSIIIFVGIVSLILDLLYFSESDWEGAISYLAFIFVLSPICILVFIPWIIWFVYQYLRNRNQTLNSYKIPLWSISLLSTYLIIHYFVIFS